jgi:hypothetical protein
VRLCVTARHNVPDRDASRDDGVGEQGAMATPPHAFQQLADRLSLEQRTQRVG